MSNTLPLLCTWLNGQDTNGKNYFLTQCGNEYQEKKKYCPFCKKEVNDFNIASVEAKEVPMSDVKYIK